MTFPERITAIRKELKISQEKFGELAGVSQRTVAFWESGNRTPSFSTLQDLAARLDVSVDYLLGRTDIKTRTNKKQPAAKNGELLDIIIDRVRDLSNPELAKLSAFLDGLEAGKDIATAKQADPDPAGKPAG